MSDYGRVAQKTFKYNNRNYPVYHYVVNPGNKDGYEVEVYKRNNRYYLTSAPTTQVSASTYYAVYDYTGSVWTQIGSYVGEAVAVEYSANSDSNSFSTDTWRSTENYGNGIHKSLAQCVSYTLSQ